MPVPIEPRSEDLPKTEVVPPPPDVHGPLRHATPGGPSADGLTVRSPVEDLELLSDLGRGAQGRVFVARQRSLADRPVIIKVTSCDGREHLSLARLQHTHIVPLYWALDDPVNDRRTLCMPYFGTVTLATLLTELRAKPPERRTGQDIVDLLDRAGATVRAELPAFGPARQALARYSFAQAVTWAGACLADALQYAHEHGLVHLDLKPSNVLIAADGQPMLLDFHLARGPLGTDGPPPPGLGGTPYYMSPEQRAALLAVKDGKAPPRPVDGRSDIYSLGLILYQLLGGPVPAAGAPRLDELNPQVSPGLADIINRCLEPEPATRYPDAAALAADLRRHLADLPLRGVPNRSLRERWDKWRRRRPQALLVILLIGVLVAAAAAAGGYYSNVSRSEAVDRITGATRHLRDGLEYLKINDPVQAVAELERCLTLARDVQGGESIERQAEVALAVARRAREAAELRRQADAIRFRALQAGEGTVDPALLQSCRALWERREQLTNPGSERARDDVEKRVRADLLDVATLWADLGPLAHQGGHDERALQQARGEALRLLGEVEALGGENAVILTMRHELANALGLHSLADRAANRLREVRSRSAWEHAALGRRLLQRGKLEAAAEQFTSALALDRRGYWPNFYSGVCAYRREKHHDAVTSFSICDAGAPAAAPDRHSAGPLSARALHHRGLAYSKLGERDLALADFDHALREDPQLAEAALQRGLLRHQRGEHWGALADFQNAMTKGADPAAVHYYIAQVHLARRDRDAALASARQALLARPTFSEARQLIQTIEAEPEK